MMRNRGFVFGLVLAAVFAVAAASLLPGQQRAAGTMEDDFTGKILMVYVSGDMDSGLYMVESARLATIGERLFLVGTGAETGFTGDWSKGMPVRIAWSAITRYYPMSAEQAKRVQQANRTMEAAMQQQGQGGAAPAGVPKQ